VGVLKAAETFYAAKDRVMAFGGAALEVLRPTLPMRESVPPAPGACTGNVLNDCGDAIDIYDRDRTMPQLRQTLKNTVRPEHFPLIRWVCENGKPPTNPLHYEDIHGVVPLAGRPARKHASFRPVSPQVVVSFQRGDEQPQP
jgi:hypothetical protein